MARHIDADKLVAEIREVLNLRQDYKAMMSYFCYEQFIELLEEAPTADVVEVKHGEWKSFEIPHMMRCSECGVSELDIHRTKFDYCPSCGAKMDGGKGE